MSDHLVTGLPLSFSPEALPRRMSFSRFLTSLLVTCPKYPTILLPHKTLSLTGSCISLMIEMLVYSAVRRIFSILSQTNIWKASILLASSAFNNYVSGYKGYQRKQVIVSVFSLSFWRSCNYTWHYAVWSQLICSQLFVIVFLPTSLHLLRWWSLNIPIQKC